MHPGAAIAESEHEKEVRYPELCHSHQVRLVVLASEVGGRWSEASVDFVRQLAHGKAARSRAGSAAQLYGQCPASSMVGHPSGRYA